MVASRAAMRENLPFEQHIVHVASNNTPKSSVPAEIHQEARNMKQANSVRSERGELWCSASSCWLLSLYKFNWLMSQKEQVPDSLRCRNLGQHLRTRMSFKVACARSCKEKKLEDACQGQSRPSQAQKGSSTSQETFRIGTKFHECVIGKVSQALRTLAQLTNSFASNDTFEAT